MTQKEMVELFSVMLLAWPNAEAFKGGIAKLGPTIKLWTVCTAEVDAWTGQQAVIRLCKTNKFPPTIAEFREQVSGIEGDIKRLSEEIFQRIRIADFRHRSLTEYYEQLPQDSVEREVIRTVGGPAALTVKLDGGNEMWNVSGIEKACRAVIRQRPTLVGGKAPALGPGKKKQEET